MNDKPVIFTQFKSWKYVIKDILSQIRFAFKNESWKMRCYITLDPHNYKRGEVYKVSYLLSRDDDKSRVGFRVYEITIDEMENLKTDGMKVTERENDGQSN